MILSLQYKSQQYIVRFDDLTKGKVIAVSENAPYGLGYIGTKWAPYTDTDCWEEVTNLNELCDKDLVLCWDNFNKTTKTIGVYDAVNAKCYSYDGNRNGESFENYRKLMPWEILPEYEKILENLED